MASIAIMCGITALERPEPSSTGLGQPPGEPGMGEAHRDSRQFGDKRDPTTSRWTLQVGKSAVLRHAWWLIGGLSGH